MADRKLRSIVRFGRDLQRIDPGCFVLLVIIQPLPVHKQVHGELMRASFAGRLSITLPLFRRRYSLPQYAGWSGRFASQSWTGRAPGGWEFVRGLRVNWWRWY